MSRPADRLEVNPEPLRVVPEDERHGAAVGTPLPRDRQRAVWVALGGDPDVWDAEHR